MSPVNFQKTIKSQAEAIVMQWPTKIFKIWGKVQKRHCYALETWNKDASRLIAWSKSPAPRTSIIIRNRCGKTHDHCCQWKKIWGRFNLHLIAHCNPTQFIQLDNIVSNWVGWKLWIGHHFHGFFKRSTFGHLESRWKNCKKTCAPDVLSVVHVRYWIMIQKNKYSTFVV